LYFIEVFREREVYFMGWPGKKRRVVKRIYEEVEVQEFSEEVGLANGRQLELEGLAVEVRGL